MGNDLRKWNCGHCGRTNKTVPAANGLVKCEYCVDVMSFDRASRPIGEILRRWAADRFSFVGRQL